MSHTYIKTLLLAGAFTTAMQPAMSANSITDYNPSTGKIKMKKGDSITINRDGKKGRTILDDVVDHTRKREKTSELTTKYNEKKII